MGIKNYNVGAYKGDATRNVVDDPTMNALKYSIEQEQKKFREDKKASFKNLFSVATEEEWISSTLGRHESFKNDPSFQWDENSVNAYVSEFDDEDVRDYVLESQSLDEAKFRHQNSQRTVKNRQMLSQYGLKGGLATAAAAMTDPVEWGAFLGLSLAASAASGPAAPVTAAGAATAKGVKTAAKGFNVAKAVANSNAAYKQGRKASILRTGAIGATEAGVAEGIRARLSPDIAEDDVMYAMLFGGMAGSGIDAIAGSFRRGADVRRLERRLETGEELSPDEIRRFGHVYDDVMLPLGKGDDTAADATSKPAFSDMSTKVEADDLDALEATAKQRGSNVLSLGLRGFFSSVAKGMNSEVGAVRSLASRLGLNAAGNKDGSKVGFSASEYQSKFSHIYRGRLGRAIRQPFSEWRGRTGGDRETFGAEITRQLRNPNHTTDPTIRAVADKIRPWFREMNEAANNYKVRGWDAVNDPNYAPRILDERSVAGLVQRHGKEQVVAMVRKSIFAAQSNIDQDLLDKVSAGYVDGILERMARGRGQGNVPMVKSIEDEAFDIEMGMLRSGMDEGDVQKAMDILFEKAEEQGRKPSKGIARSRRRLTLDEGAEHRYFDADGNEQVIRFDDMLNNDIEELMSMYTHQLGGAIGLARNGIDVEGGETFANLLNRIRDFGGQKGLNLDKLEGELQALEYMYDSVKGTFHHKNTPYGVANDNKIWRRIRALNYMRSMGASGLSAAIELGSVIGEYGVVAFIKKVPQFRQLVKLAKDGQLQDDVIRDIEAFTGTGTDVLTGVARNRYDEIDTDIVESNYTKWDQRLAKGQEVVGKFSGLGPVTVGLRRLTTRMFADTWASSLKGGKMPFSKIKMEQLGIDAEDVKLIHGVMKKHAKFDKNGKLQHLGMDKWADSPEGFKAREIFTDTMHREANNLIQETNVGNTNRFFRGEVGKTLGQFLSFVLGSTEQQTQRMAVRAVNGDAPAVARVMMSTASIGSLMYILKVNAASAGMSKREAKEYREKMLSGNRIILGSLSMMGSLGIYSTVLQRAFAGGPIISNPTLDLFETGRKAGGSLFDYAVNGDELTEREWRQFFRLAPFYTLHGVRQVADGVASKLAD